MLIGVIADDFTGGSDVANTIAKGVEPEGGLRTALFAGVPSNDASKDIEAGVVALKSRSTDTSFAVSESCKALAWLLEQGCEQIIFKYCSTFDSTDAGNIGPVAEALADALNVHGVVVCPAFPGAGRTVYQGHLFVFDQLLNESGMQHHPLTPMTDPDLRRCLARQCHGQVGHIAKATVDQGGRSILEAIEKCRQDQVKFCVVDAISDQDLLTIGSALHKEKFITGGSGVAMGLPRNIHQSRGSRAIGMDWAPIPGPAAILAGSCSGATRAQIDEHARSHSCLNVDVSKVMSNELTANDLLDFFTANSDAEPLVYSSAEPEEIKRTQMLLGKERVSNGLDKLFSDTAQLLVAGGYQNIIVAGGETSSAVAQSLSKLLNCEAMWIGPEIDPGVPILRFDVDRPVNIALKSGNFGSVEFFSKSLSLMR